VQSKRNTLIGWLIETAVRWNQHCGKPDVEIGFFIELAAACRNGFDNTSRYWFPKKLKLPFESPFNTAYRKEKVVRSRQCCKWNSSESHH